MSRKPRSCKESSVLATDIFDFSAHELYEKKYHTEHRWVFAGEKNNNDTYSGNFYFTSVTVKTATGEICDISVKAHPEGNLQGVGDYYRIIPVEHKAFCSESPADSFEQEFIASIKRQLEERNSLLEKGVFYAFDIEKGGKSEHLFFEHQEDFNKIYKTKDLKSERNNKFY